MPRAGTAAVVRMAALLAPFGGARCRRWGVQPRAGGAPASRSASISSSDLARRSTSPRVHPPGAVTDPGVVPAEPAGAIRRIDPDPEQPDHALASSVGGPAAIADGDVDDAVAGPGDANARRLGEAPDPWRRNWRSCRQATRPSWRRCAPRWTRSCRPRCRPVWARASGGGRRAAGAGAQGLGEMQTWPRAWATCATC